MAIPTRTETLDNLYTTTWQIRQPGEIDNIMTATPFWFLLNQAGNVKSQVGGRWIEQALNYAKNETVTFLGKGGTVSLNQTERLMPAVVDWKLAAVNITRYFTDDLQNMGEVQIINRVTGDLDNSRDSLIDKFETVAFGDGSSDSNQAFQGLKYWIPIAPTTGTVGGIDSATNPWWRNQYKSMSGEAASVYLVKRMRTIFNDCGKNGKGVKVFPTNIITDSATYELYEEEALELYYTTDNKVVDLGFGNLKFKGMPLLWSPSCDTGYMYFLNMNNIKFIKHPSAYFAMTDWKQVANQPNDRFAQICVYGNIFVTNRARQGVIFLIAE